MKSTSSGISKLACAATISLTAGFAQAESDNDCKSLPSQANLKTALTAARNQGNGGFNLDMWGTIVNRDGVVCAVAFTGADRGSEWPGDKMQFVLDDQIRR